MGQYFSDKTEEGIRLVWMQFDQAGIQRGVELLTEAANEGDAEALCFLARTLMGGQYVWEYAGIDEDDEKASEILKEGIRRGSACAVLIAMRCGELTPSARQTMPFASLKEARDIVLEKARAGHPFCQYMIGNTYYFYDQLEIDGVDVKTAYKDEKEMARDMAGQALKWIDQAVSGGLAGAGNNLYNLYGGNEGLPADRDKQWEVARRCAAIGSPHWEEFLAGMLYDEEDKKAEAYAWYLKAAQHGQQSSWYDVGFSRARGIGTAKDLAGAVEAFEQGAKGGSRHAQLDLGRMLLLGEGVRQDNAKAAYWLAQSVQQENKDAYPWLGYCYLRGLGVQQDDTAARGLLEKAWEADQEKRQKQNQGLYPKECMGILCNALGELYVDGRGGCAQDIKAGVEMFQEAAQRENSDAKENLSRFKKTLFGKWVRR